MIKTSDISNEILDLSKELVMVDNVNLPFSSLLLQKGTQKIGSVITDWKYEKLDSTKALALEGADVSAFQTSDRSTGDHNICQIINKAVSVSDTASAVNVESIQNLFAHELSNRVLEAKRDLEYYLVNGVYTEESGATPRQMKGLVNFISAENTITRTGAPTLTDLNEMAKKMRIAGTSSQNLALLVDYNNMDVVNTLFDEKLRYIGVTNEFGSPVLKVNLTYGSAFVYLVDSMPIDTMVLANLDLLKVSELRPLVYADLAKTGSSRKGFIEMENTLKFLNPSAATMFKKTA